MKLTDFFVKFRCLILMVRRGCQRENGIETDILFALLGEGDQTTAQEPFFTLYTTLVNELFDVGARNFRKPIPPHCFSQPQSPALIFHRMLVFVGVPAIDLTPFVQEQGPNNPAEAKASLELWNENVQTVAANLKANNSGVTTFFADMETLFRNIVNDPESIGISSDADLWVRVLPLD